MASKMILRLPTTNGIRSAIVIVILCLFAGGCSIGYVIKQGARQLNISINSREIADMLVDPSVAEEDKAQLRFILDIKKFAEEKIGLAKTGNYERFYNTGGEAVSYTVSACEKLRFEPYRWEFLVAGSFPYKGYVKLEEAVAERDRLRNEGYDTAIHTVAAYSTLGWFSDPVFSTMLKYSKRQLADLIIHELVHATIYAKDNADFNESIATFIAAKGTILYMVERYGKQSPEYRESADYYHDERLFTNHVNALYDNLNALFRTKSSKEELLQRKAEIVRQAAFDFRAVMAKMRTRTYGGYLDRQLNNAEILAIGRYNGGDYEGMFHAAADCLRCFVAKMKRQ